MTENAGIETPESLFPDLPQVPPRFWRKKPVVVEARQLPDDVDWRSDVTHEIAYDLARWCGGAARFAYCGGEPVPQILVSTLEGEVRATPGDWIVKGSHDGEFWPVRGDIFAETYEPAGDQP